MMMIMVVMMIYIYYAEDFSEVYMYTCLYVCHVFAYFVGKIILAGDKKKFGRRENYSGSAGEKFFLQVGRMFWKVGKEFLQVGKLFWQRR